VPTMSADQEGRGVTIAEASRRLGVSENAVRQRIKRGTVAAWKVDGVWRIMIAGDGAESDHEADYQRDQQADQERRLSGDQPPTNTPAVSLAARAQLSAIVEEMLAPLVAQHEARTAELAKEVGRLEAERDALWSTVERLEAELATSQDTTVDANQGLQRAETPETTDAAAASWWTRLRRFLTGA
jgi:uncharacterized small protein (DUF1192 family)